MLPALQDENLLKLETDINALMKGWFINDAEITISLERRKHEFQDLIRIRQKGFSRKRVYKATLNLDPDIITKNDEIKMLIVSLVDYLYVSVNLEPFSYSNNKLKLYKRIDETLTEF